MSAAVALLALAILVLAVPGRAAALGRLPSRALPLLPASTARWREAAGRSRRAARTRAEVTGLLDALAAELRAGRSPSAALTVAAQQSPALVAHALGAIRYGGPVPPALQADARAPGAAGLRRLAACWRVAEHTGAGLAAAVARLAAAERESARVRLELAARAAEPRATMRVLAALPLVGIAFGTLVGADPWGWLTGTAAGRVVLAGGLGLDLVGVLWARRMTAAVEALL